KVVGDYPRGLRNRLFLRLFPVPDAFAIAPALAVPLLLAGRRSPVPRLGLPARPFLRRLAADRAAIALLRMPRPKALLAALQQAPARQWSATRWPASPRRRLLSAMACWILGWAHGR